MVFSSDKMSASHRSLLKTRMRSPGRGSDAGRAGAMLSEQDALRGQIASLPTSPLSLNTFSPNTIHHAMFTCPNLEQVFLLSEVGGGAVEMRTGPARARARRSLREVKHRKSAQAGDQLGHVRVVLKLRLDHHARRHVVKNLFEDVAQLVDGVVL